MSKMEYTVEIKIGNKTITQKVITASAQSDNAIFALAKQQANIDDPKDEPIYYSLTSAKELKE